MWYSASEQKQCLFKCHTWLFLASMQAFIRNHKIVTRQQFSNYHTCTFLPSQSTHFKILHLMSTHILFFSFITTHLPRSLSSEALFGVNILATHYLMTSLIHFLKQTTLSSDRHRKGDRITPPMPRPSWPSPGDVPLGAAAHDAAWMLPGARWGRGGRSVVPRANPRRVQ